LKREKDEEREESKKPFSLKKKKEQEKELEVEGLENPEFLKFREWLGFLRVTKRGGECLTLSNPILSHSFSLGWVDS
jgi:hypothetical protein